MFKEQKLSGQNGNSATVSIKNWLLLDCLAFLNLIPIIGSVAYIVIILIIGFGTKTAISLKNRVIAALIWAGIWIVLTFIFSLLFGATIMDMVGELLPAMF
ncbi:MAG: hypothetical protein FWD27_01920 [Coriobacteriia bacterium]|nr:hypothetical protein [Coriobacteriia bacterium]